MRYIVTCGLTFFFPHYLIIGVIFKKEKVIENKKYFFNFSTTFGLKYIILGRIQGDMVKNIY